MDFNALGARFEWILKPPAAVFWLPKGHRIWRNVREAFQVERLALMIRATRSRSMDGWSGTNQIFR